MYKGKKITERNLAVALAIAMVIHRKTKKLRRIAAVTAANRKDRERAKKRIEDYREGRLKGIEKARMDLKQLSTNTEKTKKRFRLIRRLTKKAIG